MGEHENGTSEGYLFFLQTEGEEAEATAEKRAASEKSEAGRKKWN